MNNFNEEINNCQKKNGFQDIFFFYQNHWLFYTCSAFERLNAINLQREKYVFNAFNIV